MSRDMNDEGDLPRLYDRGFADGLSADAREAHARGWAAAIEAAVPVIRRFLQFDSQRAVSWHEVQDAIDAIRALASPSAERAEPAPVCATCGGVVNEHGRGPLSSCPTCGGGR